MRRAAARAPLVAWLLVLAAAYATVLNVNLPGHLSVDSVISLAEGRTGQRITWGPPMYSWILGAFDSLVPGTGLYISANLLLLMGSWAFMPALRPRTWWTGPVLLALAVALPQISVYQGIVWKDVLFANLTVAAFVALAFALKDWADLRQRLPLLALVAVLLALGSLVRQNGFISMVAAGLAVGWVGVRAGRQVAGVGWGAGLAAAAFVLMLVLDAIVPVEERPGADLDRGIRVVQQYDIIGAVAHDPGYPLPVMEARSPEVAAMLRREAARVFSPARSDTLNLAPRLGGSMWGLDGDIVDAQWRQMILADPVGYARRRLEVFTWVFATPTIDKCLPVHVGVGGRPEDLRLAGIDARLDRDDRRIYNYVTWYLDTPAMSHVPFAAAALLAGLFLLWRGGPADVAMAGMQVAALTFAASFFVLSLACDYRYLYVLDLAALTALLYLALDPRLRRAAPVT